jgi:hypothetical protein
MTAARRVTMPRARRKLRRLAIERHLARKLGEQWIARHHVLRHAFDMYAHRGLHQLHERGAARDAPAGAVREYTPGIRVVSRDPFAFACEPQ